MAWDEKIATDAVVAEQCMKLGAVLLKPKDKPAAGFAPPKAP